MTEYNYVNFHVLISHSPSCLNRDDMNMQKTATFGGVRRVRISSQSLKRAMRTSPYYEQHLGQPSVRTNRLDLLDEHLASELQDEFPRELVEEAIRRFSQTEVAGESEEAAEGDDADVEADDAPAEKKKKLAVAPWVAAEIRELCRVIQGVKAEGLAESERSKAAEKYRAQKVKKGASMRPEQDFLDEIISKKIEKAVDKSDAALTLRRALGKAVDVALSGRMATSGLMTSVDGAMALAHVLTTHAVESDIDWFTAADDLKMKAGEPGASHLDTQEMSAGVFYRYASLNVRQLLLNLGEISKLSDPVSPEQRAQTLRIATHLLHLLATVVPNAKRQSTAADNAADFALVSLSTQPLSLANAFEEAITSRNGFFKPSVQALTGYWACMKEAYDLDERCAGFSTRPSEVKGLPIFKGLAQLRGWLATDGLGQ